MKKTILMISLTVFFVCLVGPSAIAEEELPVTVTASSVYNGRDQYYGPNKTVDGNLNTIWIGGFLESPWWIMFDARTMHSIGIIRMFWHTSSFAPKDYDIQVSNDGLSWENLFSGIEGAYKSEGEERVINRDTRYIRLYIRSTRSAFPILKEFKVYVQEDFPVSRTMRFQGKLKDADGLPLQGLFEVTFRLYKRETEGAPVWQETQTDIAIEEGLLDVELGSVTPLALDFDKQYWLSVEVESDGEMTPRFKLTCVPYSLAITE